MQEKDILQGYEIINWEFGPRFYKIIAAATALTLLPIFVLGQTDMFSKSACASPFVGSVCDVLDTVYVGTKILAKDTGYFEGEYQDIKLQEENEIIWTNETEVEPQIQYPEGYFEVANRDELAAIRALANPDAGFNAPISPLTPNPISPPIPKYNPSRASNNRGGKRKPVYPKRRSGGALDGDIGDDPIGDLMAGNDGDGKKDGDSSKTEPKKTPEPKETPAKKTDNPLGDTTAVSSDPVNDKPINRKTLYDLADITLERVEAKKVDLGQQFIVRMNGVVDADGMLDAAASGWGKAEGNEQMIELAKIAIEKVGVSGWLKYLSDEDASRLNIMFGQNEERMVADVRSDLQDANKAKTAATGLRGLIQATIFAHNNGVKEMKEDEIQLLKAVTVTSEGRLLVIKFDLDKKEGQQIIATRLAEYKQKKAEEARKKAGEGKPSGSLSKASRDAKSGK